MPLSFSTAALAAASLNEPFSPVRNITADECECDKTRKAKETDIRHSFRGVETAVGNDKLELQMLNTIFFSLGGWKYVDHYQMEKRQSLSLNTS